MDHPAAAAAFWIARWESKQIGFHEGLPNARLVEYWSAPAGRVLVPLCGASVDLAWLAARGNEVVGVELAELAIRRFFDDHGLVPEVDEVEDGRRWRGGAVTILQGDLFAVDAAVDGPFDAVYDRAALIALPPELRAPYVERLKSWLRPGATGLLISFNHEPCDRSGPPFPVGDEEIRALWPGAEKVTEAPVTEEKWREVPGVREGVWRVGR